MKVKTLETCFNEKIERKNKTFDDTFEDRIQNAILTAIVSIVSLKTESAIKSINESFGRNATSVTANSERWELVRITAPFENASENNIVLNISNVYDETPNIVPDKVIDFSVPETRFVRQLHTHHLVTGPRNATHHLVIGQTAQTNQILESLTGRISTPHNPPSQQLQSLSTQVSQDNTLPIVEQTPKNQISDTNNSVDRSLCNYRNGNRTTTTCG